MTTTESVSTVARLARISGQLAHAQEEMPRLAAERDTLVRLLVADGMPQSSVALVAGVSRQRIWQIVKGE